MKWKTSLDVLYNGCLKQMGIDAARFHNFVTTGWIPFQNLANNECGGNFKTAYR